MRRGARGQLLQTEHRVDVVFLLGLRERPPVTADPQGFSCASLAVLGAAGEVGQGLVKGIARQLLELGSCGSHGSAGCSWAAQSSLRGCGHGPGLRSKQAQTESLESNHWASLRAVRGRGRDRTGTQPEQRKRGPRTGMANTLSVHPLFRSPRCSYFAMGTRLSH